MISIAIILPDTNKDYLANTVLDGFRALEHTKEYLIRISPRFIAVADYSDWELEDGAFIQFAQKADLILFIHAKYSTKDLVEKIGLWNKTVCIDGSETGKNNRYDFAVQNTLIMGTHQGGSAVQYDLLKKSRSYFRREKPYYEGITPFPFGIEDRFISYTQGQQKDIDFACIFGQDEYPPLRKYATEMLENFCVKNGFTYATSKTNSLFNRDFRNTKSQEKFHDILGRAKVGVSIGGGGYDTLRFWEILANNCVLLTESIDIYHPNSPELDFKRIFGFKNLFDFEYRLKEIGALIRSGDIEKYMDMEEYRKILSTHSTAERVRELVRISLAASA